MNNCTLYSASATTFNIRSQDEFSLIPMVFVSDSKKCSYDDFIKDVMLKIMTSLTSDKLTQFVVLFRTDVFDENGVRADESTEQFSNIG